MWFEVQTVWLEMQPMWLEMLNAAFLCTHGQKSASFSLKTQLDMWLEMLIMLFEVSQSGCNPHQYWVCGVPSLYYYRFTHFG